MIESCVNVDALVSNTAINGFRDIPVMNQLYLKFVRGSGWEFPDQATIFTWAHVFEDELNDSLRRGDDGATRQQKLSLSVQELVEKIPSYLCEANGKRRLNYLCEQAHYKYIRDPTHPQMRTFLSYRFRHRHRKYLSEKANAAFATYKLLTA